MVESPPSSRKRRIMAYDEGDDTKAQRESSVITEPLLKVLVPNYVAGAIIGKGGASLTELKNKFGGFIRISGGLEYYPGTEERIVVITGQESEITNICDHIMEKVENPGRDDSMRQVEIDPVRAKKVKIVLTGSACGFLIGRGGETIKAIQEGSGAKLHVTMPDKVTFPGEKVLSVSGTFDARASACKQVIETVARNKSNMANTMTKYPNILGDGANMASDQYIPLVRGQEPFVSPYQHPPRPSIPPRKSNIKSRVTIEMEIPDNLVGRILGKQGCFVKEMVQQSGGARFKFADEKPEDSDERTLTITGNLVQANLAHMLLNERLAEIEGQILDKMVDRNKIKDMAFQLFTLS